MRVDTGAQLDGDMAHLEEQHYGGGQNGEALHKENVDKVAEVEPVRGRFENQIRIVRRRVVDVANTGLHGGGTHG